jgi:ATP-dependent Clp protease adaptor protein ClpS
MTISIEYINNVDSIPLLSEQVEEGVLLDEDIGNGTTNAAKVILFNDDWHTFDEVINQIIKATGCSLDKAESLTWEVHNKGKAMVYSGDMDMCLKVSGVLEEINLHTQIEY